MSTTSNKITPNYLLLTVLAVLLLLQITAATSETQQPVATFNSILTFDADTTPAPVAAPQRKNAPLPANRTDTLPPAADTSGTDSLRTKVDTFQVRLSRDSIDAPVTFQAEDSMILDIPAQKIYIYNKAQVAYKDIKLEAAVIQLDQPSQILTAYPVKDSAGMPEGVPAFTQGESAFTSDTIRYNFKTQRGLTIGTYTQEGEMFIYGEKVKRIDPQTFFAQKARFTSCNYDTPHFAFRARRVKFISEKLAVTGLVRPEFEGVPIPIGLPFGLFPLKTGRRTGILAPQPVVNEQLGFGLEGLGYYKTFGEYWDATFRANIYSYGSWNLFITPTYRKRYRYNGGFNLSYMNNQLGFKGDPDYRPPTRNFAIRWNHSVDGKARPGQSFSASVNLATSLFNQFFPNNAQQNFDNSLNSSIAYQKTWAGKPFNLTLSANHNQNTLQRLFNVSLPDAGFTVNTIFPFQRKNPVGAPKWYEKLGVAYNGTFFNRFSFYDTAFSWQQLRDTFDWGARHSIPIQLSLPPMGPIQVGPAISYNEVWHSRSFLRRWDTAGKRVETTTERGFYRERQMSVGLNVSTALFGTKNFRRPHGIQAIRHVVRPTVGFSYVPDINRNRWYQVQVDTLGNRLWFDRLNGATATQIPDFRSANLSFVLDNNLEMKVRKKGDTTEEGVKKVRLIDGFGLNGSYNILRDSFNLSDFQFYLRSNFFEKINLTASANISPYQQDAQGRLINRYMWQGDKFSIGRITGGFVSISTDFKSKPKDEKKAAERQQLLRNRRNDYDEASREMGMIQNNPEEYADFNVPWSINLGYALNFTRVPRADFSGFTTQLNQAISFNGDFNLTEKWKVMYQGNFDVQGGKLQFFTTSITRDLHCWQMSLNVTPVGIMRSFNISINAKSQLLRDLRINRSRFFYRLPQ
jgi:hypothetical protein